MTSKIDTIEDDDDFGDFAAPIGETFFHLFVWMFFKDYSIFFTDPPIAISTKSLSNAEPAVFKTKEFFSTLTDQGSVFKTTFDQVTSETFVQEKTSSNIPEFSSISSKSQTPPPNPKGFQTSFKSVEPTVFQGFEPKNDEFGGFESSDTMPKVMIRNV